MATGKQSKLTGSEMGNTLDQARPILVDKTDIQHAHQVQPHRHLRGQLIYAAKGVMQVQNHLGHWYIPPQQAVWIPPGFKHAIKTSDAVHYRSLFIMPNRTRQLPDHAQPVAIQALLKELILTAAEFENDYQPQSAEGRLMTVLMDQIATLQTPRFTVPLPANRRLQHLVSRYLENPDENCSLSDWARQANTSSRTLERIFNKETGLGFRDWQQHIKVQKAIDMLQNDASVTTTALQLGYNSISAFSAMFRRVTGINPSQYMKQYRDI